MSEDKTVAAVERVLGAPVMPELSENALKVRRNLLVVSLIDLFLVLGGIRVAPDSPLLGMKFSGLTDDLIFTGLLLTTAYLLVHFAWCAHDNFAEWRLRISGMKLSFITGARFTSEHGDYPDDPRQSTLYSWWSGEARSIGNIGQVLGNNALEVQNPSKTGKSPNLWQNLYTEARALSLELQLSQLRK